MATHSSILFWKTPWTEELDKPNTKGSQELDMTECLHTHTHNGLPAPSAQRIKFKLLISRQPLPMFSTYYKPPLIAVHPSSVFLLFFKHSSSPALQTCLFLISLFPNQSVPGQPIKNSLLTPGTITYSVYLCLFSACLSHQTVSSMKEEIKSIFPSSFI